MKCLNCGRETQKLLCENCRSDEIIESVFNQMMYFSAENCENEQLLEFSRTLEQPYMVKGKSESLLELCSGEIHDFLQNKILEDQRNVPLALEAAKEFVGKYPLKNRHTQMILNYLLDKIMYEYDTAEEYFARALNTSGLCLELYFQAMEFYGQIGDYDKADDIYDKAMREIEMSQCSILFGNIEQKKNTLEEKKARNDRWRNKPYWPNTEERRIKLAAVYDSKGITYGRIKEKPKTVSENDFKPFEMCYEIPESFVSFWLEEAAANNLGRSVFFDIGAVKVVSGQIAGQFSRIVNPMSLSWGDSRNMKTAVKISGLSEEELKKAADIDTVLDAFFEFSGGLTLVNTGAAGSQGKLLERGARYSGRDRIDNAVCDVLDIADDMGITPATRDGLLAKFGLKDGVNAVEKAAANIEIINCLK